MVICSMTKVSQEVVYRSPEVHFPPGAGRQAVLSNADTQVASFSSWQPRKHLGDVHQERGVRGFTLPPAHCWEAAITIRMETL